MMKMNVYNPTNLDGRKTKIVKAVISNDYKDAPDYVNGRPIYGREVNNVSPNENELGRIYNARFDGQNLVADLHLFEDKINHMPLEKGFTTQLVLEGNNPNYLIFKPAGYSQNQNPLDGITAMAMPAPICAAPVNESPYDQYGNIRPIYEDGK